MISKRAIQERINNYLENCGNGDTNFIVKAKKCDNSQYYKCSFCGSELGVFKEGLANFCPQCGCLLDWSEKYGV